VAYLMIGPPVGSADIPKFEAMSIDGELVTEEIFTDGGLLHFFRSTCGYCVHEMYNWSQYKVDHPEVKLIAVLHKQSLQQAKSFFTNGIWPFDMVINDPNDLLWKHMKAEYTPQTWLISSDLKVIESYGVMSQEDFQSLSLQLGPI
jgi:hypothetical protein